MNPSVLLFLYGLAAGFAMIRIGRLRRRGRAPAPWLMALGWLLTGLSFTLALILLATGSGMVRI